MTPGSSAPLSTAVAGQVLGGRYRVGAALGQGASAAVFAAEDLVLRRQVAVKVLHPGLAADDVFLRRFQEEARVAAALRHPNVLAVHDWGDAGGTPYLVTELLEGGSLKDLIDQGWRATPSQALQLGLEACRALDHAHRRGLVHRDVKPANLLFDDDGVLRVADFGLARAIAEAAATEPLGAVLGTARYASPEQVEGRTLDGRSDVYSLALVLVEAITGQVPFAAETSAASLLARLERSLEPPAAAGPLIDALAAAGRRDPGERVDATGFGRMLKVAAADLDRPDPLPIVRFDGQGADAPQSVRTALTDLTVLADPGPSELAGAFRDDPGPDVAHAAKPRRRVRLLVLLAVVVAMAASGGAAAVFQPWRATVDVPALVGLSRDEAATRLSMDDLRLHEGPTAASESVEAGRVLAFRPPRQRQGRAVTVTLSAGPEPRIIPNVAARLQGQVAAELVGLGLKVVSNTVDSETVPADAVLSIDPPAGTAVPRGATVMLSVSGGPSARPVPSVTGKTFDEAAAALNTVGLAVTRVDAFDDKVEAGKVISANPVAGTPVRPGVAVAITVSKGPDLVAVPGVLGRTPTAAQQALMAVGLQVSATYGPPGGTVFSTLPGAGVKAKRGSSVALYTR